MGRLYRNGVATQVALIRVPPPKKTLKKTFLRGSLRESFWASRRTPPQKSERRLSRRHRESNFTCFFDTGDSFLTLLGGSAGLPETQRLPRDTFLTFGPGPVLTPLRAGDHKRRVASASLQSARWKVTKKGKGPHPHEVKWHFRPCLTLKTHTLQIWGGGCRFTPQNLGGESEKKRLFCSAL